MPVAEKKCITEKCKSATSISRGKGVWWSAHMVACDVLAGCVSVCWELNSQRMISRYFYVYIAYMKKMYPHKREFAALKIVAIPMSLSSLQ